MLTALCELCDEYVKENMIWELSLKFLNTIPRNVMPEETFDALVFLLCQNTHSIIISDYFLDISLDLLRFILSEDILSAAEDKLFDAVIKWCENQFKIANLAVSGQSKRKILNGCEYLIRFGSMSLDTFMKCYNSEPDFFTAEEFRDIICDIFNKTDQSPFLKYKRLTLDD